jgi:hypothetical protein
MAIRNTLAIPLAAGLVMTLLLGIGVIPAAAQAGTVSAKGNGQVAIGEECSAAFSGCVGGGQGVQFSFDFTGPAPTLPNQPALVTGTLSAKFRLTGDQIQFVTGPAEIFPNEHFLLVQGTCTITTAAGTTSLGSCFAEATEFTQPNSGNQFTLQFFGPMMGFTFAGGQVVSGSMQID